MTWLKRRQIAGLQGPEWWLPAGNYTQTETGAKRRYQWSYV
jgi:hypothetical protein